MIKREEMLPMLVEACPSFSKRWEEHKRFYKDEENYLPYVALGEFANHLVDLYKENKVEEFAKVFDIVEELHVKGDEYVKNAAVVGFIEGLQNITGNRNLDPEIFYKYLRPVSAKWWNEMNKLWENPIEYYSQLKDE